MAPYQKDQIITDSLPYKDAVLRSIVTNSVTGSLLHRIRKASGGMLEVGQLCLGPDKSPEIRDYTRDELDRVFFWLSAMPDFQLMIDHDVPKSIARQMRAWAARLQEGAEAIEKIPDVINGVPKVYIVRDTVTDQEVGQGFLMDQALDLAEKHHAATGNASRITTRPLETAPGQQTALLNYSLDAEALADVQPVA